MGQTTQIKNVHQRILGVMSELDYIQKSDKVAEIGAQRYRFVSHDQVSAAVHPLLVKHGLTMIPTVDSITQEGNRTCVQLIVYIVNVDDPKDCIMVKYAGYGIDSGDKGVGKAISYAYKYACLKIFCLETGDDPDYDQEVKYEAPKCVEFDEIFASLYDGKKMSQSLDAYLKSLAEKMVKARDRDWETRQKILRQAYL